MSNPVPDGWEESSFVDFATLQRGFDLPVQNRVEGKYPIFGSNGVVGTHNKPSVHGECVVTGRSGSLGDVWYFESDIWALNTSLYVKDFHGNSAKYVYYFLKYFNLERFGSGTGVPTLNRNDVHIQSIIYPSLPEQQKIAAILSTVDDVIEKTRAQIDKLKDLKTGMMQELLTKGIGHAEFKDSPVGRIPVGWEVVQLNDLAKVGSSKRIRESEYVSEGVPFYRSKEVIRRSKGLELEKTLYISRQRFSEISEKFGAPVEGDILVTAVGTIGTVYLVDNREFYFKDGNLLWLRNISPSISPKYLAKIMQSEAFQAEIDRVTGGSSQAALTIEKLQELSILLPPIAEQSYIVDALSSLDDKYHATYQKLTSQQQLKKALMQDLLTGKVRVNVDNKESAVA